jgi:hypothetical protein
VRTSTRLAIGHGLSHTPVKSVMGSVVVTCGEDTPLPGKRLVSGATAAACPSSATARP